jgi:hypothetical protein
MEEEALGAGFVGGGLVGMAGLRGGLLVRDAGGRVVFAGVLLGVEEGGRAAGDGGEEEEDEDGEGVTHGVIVVLNGVNASMLQEAIVRGREADKNTLF